MNAIQIREWRPLRKGSLLGFAKIQLPSGMVLHDVTILLGDKGPWASPPSKPMIGRDGIAMKDANGKVRYSPLVEFANKEIRENFSSAANGAPGGVPMIALLAPFPRLFTVRHSTAEEAAWFSGRRNPDDQAETIIDHAEGDEIYVVAAGDAVIEDTDRCAWSLKREQVG